jgi:hypothetical protein
MSRKGLGGLRWAHGLSAQATSSEGMAEAASVAAGATNIEPGGASTTARGWVCTFAAYCHCVPPVGSGREPRVSATTGLIVSIAGTALAALLILIVLLYPVFRSHPAASPGVQPTRTSSTSPAPAISQVVVHASSGVQIVVFPTAITVSIAGGDSGLPEWSPILVAFIGVLGGISVSFVGYFLQRGRSESKREPPGTGTPEATG